MKLSRDDDHNNSSGSKKASKEKGSKKRNFESDSTEDDSGQYQFVYVIRHCISNEWKCKRGSNCPRCLQKRDFTAAVRLNYQ